MSVLPSAVILLAVIATAYGEPPRAPAQGGPYPPSGWKPSGRLFLLPVRQAPRDSYNAPPPAGQYGPPPTPAPAYGPPSTQATPSTTVSPLPSTEAPPPTTEMPTTTEETVEPTTQEPEYEDDDVDADAGSEPVGTTKAVANAFARGDGARASARAVASVSPSDEGGVYFVLLPDGRLQRVAYTTSRDQRAFQRLVAAPAPSNAGFLAIQYQDVEPVDAPVYQYGPDHALLRIH